MAPALPLAADIPCPADSPRGFAKRSYAIHTDLIFTNSRMPYSESSRP
jgi:hypothetical protein